MILDGTSLAQSIYAELHQKVASQNSSIKLGAVLVGNSSASLRYIRQKRKFAKKVGIEFELFQLPEDISQNDLIENITALNENPSITGYIVQLPLPNHINELDIIRAIDPKKDVDGFHPENQGKVMIDDKSGFTPCTPAGVMKIFEHYNINLSGKQVVVIGKSNIVGKPLMQLCISQGATVTSCNSKTPDLSIYTKLADIVIVATGKAHLLGESMLKKESVVIDVGFSVIDKKIYGDADYENILAAGHSITPVPGGVGPMTVAMLLSNVYTAYEISR